MANAVPLNTDIMDIKNTRPAAATNGRRVGRTTPNDTQFSVRLPADIVRAIKRDAFDANKTPGAYILACYQAGKKAGL